MSKAMLLAPIRPHCLILETIYGDFSLPSAEHEKTTPGKDCEYELDRFCYACGENTMN